MGWARVAAWLWFVMVVPPLLAADPSPQEQTRGAVAFVAPAAGGRTVGTVTIKVRVAAPPGALVERVELSVDGKPLSTIRSAPWQTVWDAGDGLDAHRLDAVARFSDGSEARAVLRTTPLVVNFWQDVPLVNLYAVVRDRRGEYVTDLVKDDFRIAENGRPQVIDRFSKERKPLRVGIVLDTSLSMKRGDRIDAARRSAVRFLDVMEPGDEGIVVTFNDAVTVAQELTHDKSAMVAAIESISAQGGTALYDAIFRTSEMLERFDGRRVLVLLSDGKDEAASGLEPGSLHTVDEALDRALRSEVMIFAIGLGRGLDQEYDFHNRETLAAILTRIAESTGGRVLFRSEGHQLKRAFELVTEDLRNQYSLAYIPEDRKRDGRWREIRLTTLRPELKISTRQGYFAPSDPHPVAPRRRSAPPASPGGPGEP